MSTKRHDLFSYCLYKKKQWKQTNRQRNMEEEKNQNTNLPPDDKVGRLRKHHSARAARRIGVLLPWACVCVCPANPAVPEIKEENPESSRMCVRPPRSVEIPLFFFFFSPLSRSDRAGGIEGGRGPPRPTGSPQRLRKESPATRTHTYTVQPNAEFWARGGRGGFYDLRESLSRFFFSAV